MKQRTYVLKTAAAAAIAALALVISCVPPLEDGGLQSNDAAQSITGAAITVTVVEPGAGRAARTNVSLAGPARSLTGPQTAGVINYYELAVQKLDKATGAVTTDANNRGWTYKHATAKPGGTLVIGVDPGFNYGVLFLAGYLPGAGQDPVLLRSAYGRTVETGGLGATQEVRLTLTAQMVSIDPATGYAISLADDGSGVPDTSVSFGRDGQGVMTLAYPKYEMPLESNKFPRSHIAAAWSTNGYVKVSAGGLSALVQALNGDEGDDDIPAGTVVTDLFDGGADLPVLNLTGLMAGQTDSNFVLEKPWNKPMAAGGGLTGSGGTVGLEWTVDATTEWSATDCDALLSWQANYHAFGQQANGALTRWQIRNGLDNTADRMAAGVGNTGGAVYVKIGLGGGGIPVDGPNIIVPPTWDTEDFGGAYYRVYYVDHYTGAPVENSWEYVVAQINAQPAGTAGDQKNFVINLTGDVEFGVAVGYTANTFTQAYHRVSLRGASAVKLGTGDGSLLNIGANQTVILRGPELTGKTANTASLVTVGAAGTFVMRGGAVRDNAVSGNGGGVWAQNAAFTMYDGAISNNSAVNGGGVFVQNTTFTVYDGTISNNDAVTDGGGMYLVGGGTTATFWGGSILSNTAGSGGGMYANGNIIHFYAVTITGNSASWDGGWGAGRAYSGGGAAINNGLTYFHANGGVNPATCPVYIGGNSSICASGQHRASGNVRAWGENWLSVGGTFINGMAYGWNNA